MRNNVERHGILYTPVADLEEFGDVTELVSIFNRKLYYKHTDRRARARTWATSSSGGTRTTPSSIVEKLQEHALSGIDGYRAAVEWWLDEPLTRHR